MKLWPAKPPPPPAEPYFGHDASHASLALMKELGINDPMQCNQSLVLPAGHDLEPLQRNEDRQVIMHQVLVMMMVAAAVLSDFMSRGHLERLHPYKDLLVYVAAMLFGLTILHFGFMRWYSHWLRNKPIRKMTLPYRRRRDLKKFPVYINHPWVYEYTQDNCDLGLAIFDPAHRLLIIEGLHYRYFISAADITQLQYLSSWGLVRDVHLAVMMNEVPFEIVLSRYSFWHDLPAAVLPHVTTRRLVKLARETLGQQDPFKT